LSGNVIQEYTSTSEAHKENRGALWDALNGKRKTANGFTWKYKK